MLTEFQQIFGTLPVEQIILGNLKVWNFLPVHIYMLSQMNQKEYQDLNSKATCTTSKTHSSI